MGVVYFTGYQYNIAAFGVGVAVGIGVRAGNRDKRDEMAEVAGHEITEYRLPTAQKSAGVLAAIIALAAIFVGKYVTFQIYVNAVPDVEQIEANLEADDDRTISYIADDVIYEYDSAGQAVDWPAGVTPYQPQSPGEYPSEVWIEAQSRWSGMTEGERTAYRLAIARYQAPLYEQQMRAYTFIDSFVRADAAFLLLAVITAYPVAAQARTRETGVDLADC